MRSVGTNINVFLDVVGTNYQVVIDGNVALTAHNSTGAVDIAPVLRDYLNSSHVDIGTMSVEGDSAFVDNPITGFANRQFLVVDVDQTQNPVQIIVSSEIPDTLPDGAMLITNDYNWRSETTVPDGLRMTSRVVGGRVDSRQFVFASAKSAEPGISVCKTYEVPVYNVTFTLDYATPFSVTVQRPAGLYTLPTSAELGFVVDDTHEFVAWTYLGRQITSINVEGDVTIEGIAEALPAHNLLRATRHFSNMGSISALGSADMRAYTGYSGGTSWVRRGYGDYTALGVYSSNSYESVLQFYPKPRPTQSGIYVFSMLWRSLSASSGLSVPGRPSSGAQGGLRAFVDGAEVPIGSQLTRLPIVDTEQHFVEIVYYLNASIGLVPLYWLMEQFGTCEIWLPKLEDVTDQPEANQRATAWVPHVDDPPVTLAAPLSAGGLAAPGTMSAEIAGATSACNDYYSRSVIEGFRVSNIICPSTMRIGVRPSGAGSEYDGQDVRILCNCRQKYAVYAVNRDGGITTCLFDGRSMESAGFSAFDIEINSLQPNYPTTRFTNRISTEGRRRWRLNSGKLFNEDGNDMVDIATSPRVWLHDLETDRLYAVNCVDSQVDKKRRINSPGEVINYTMTFEEARINVRR